MKDSKRKIAVVTGTRAEYGLLYWIIKEIDSSPDLILQLIVTGMHLSPDFGLTYQEIEKDGFQITEKVEMLLSSDTEVGISTSIGLGIIGFSKVFDKLKPDIILVLGDRFEILSVATAAVIARIPVAHIHGGEATEGLIDEPIRHAVTKMSHIHFPATEFYASRIRQMGENTENIFTYGAPGLDNVYRLKLPGIEELSKELKIDFGKKVAVITYHPVTLENHLAEQHMRNILSVLSERDLTLVFTYANADTGGRVINLMISDFVKSRSNAYAFTNLGRLKYLGLLNIADVMIGNSSSGIIEAPSFKLPVVNVGDRQRGRVKSSNIIDCGVEQKEIALALDQALNNGFRESLENLNNPYGKGDTSSKIVATLKSIRLDGELIKKKFKDLPCV